MMGMKEDCSGREKTRKRSLVKEKNLKKKIKTRRKAGNIQELKALVKEARRTGPRSDWRVPAMGISKDTRGSCKDQSGRCYL